MDFFRHHSFRILCALLAFLVLGDIVADGIHDAIGICATESQDSGHNSCPTCGCTIHTGSAVAPDSIVFLNFATQANEVLAATVDEPALGAAPAIYHPPQLA